jgi:IclR family acetate operon transcriptional repressor
MRALDRVTAILEAVSSSGSGASLSDIAVRTGLSLPTASRLVRDLAEQDLLQRVDGARLYRIGARLLAIASAASGRNPVIEVAVSPMVQLRDQTRETVSLHMQVGDRRVCIAEVQSTNEVRRVVPVGFSVPLHYGATGEVLLAFLPEAASDGYVATLDLEPASSRKLVNRLRAIRERGWAMASESWSKGVAGLATPVRSPDGTVYALSVSGPSSRLTPELMSGLVDTLQAAGQAISAALGAALPTIPVTGGTAA